VVVLQMLLIPSEIVDYEKYNISINLNLYFYQVIKTHII